MLLKKFNEGNNKPKSAAGLKVALYIISLIIAFVGGAQYERSKIQAPTQSQAAMEPAAEATPSTADIPQISATRPSATPVPEASAVAVETPMRIEKAIPVTPVATPHATSAAVATSAASPDSRAGSVTLVEPVQIPVKQSGKIVGYINLQRGQQIVPVAVEKDQIKVKCGEEFVYVPVKSTDMTR